MSSCDDHRMKAPLIQRNAFNLCASYSATTAVASESRAQWLTSIDLRKDPQ